MFLVALSVASMSIAGCNKSEKKAEPSAKATTPVVKEAPKASRADTELIKALRNSGTGAPKTYKNKPRALSRTQSRWVRNGKTSFDALPQSRRTKKRSANFTKTAAVGFGALESTYGKTILTGLLFGALGDVLLLGETKKAFIGGLVAFLIGHVAYVVAFAMLPQHTACVLSTLPIAAIALFFVARWVFPHAADMRIPIAMYMLVIGLMVTAAVGAAGAGAPWMIPLGATMFAVSDIAVVRHRFVKRAFSNKAWGLPLYFAAQLLIAWSIAAVG